MTIEKAREIIKYAEQETNKYRRDALYPEYQLSKPFAEGWESRQAEIDRLIKERDLSREMLLSDKTHVACKIYEDNLKKKIHRLRETLDLSRCYCHAPIEFICPRCVTLKSCPEEGNPNV